MSDRPLFTREPGESLDGYIARLQAVDAVALPDPQRNALNFSLRDALRERGQVRQDELARQGISRRAGRPPRPSAEPTPLERARKVVASLNDRDRQLLLREMMEAEAKDRQV